MRQRGRGSSGGRQGSGVTRDRGPPGPFGHSVHVTIRWCWSSSSQYGQKTQVRARRVRAARSHLRGRSGSASSARAMPTRSASPSRRMASACSKAKILPRGHDRRGEARPRAPPRGCRWPGACSRPKGSLLAARDAHRAAVAGVGVRRPRPPAAAARPRTCRRARRRGSRGRRGPAPPRSPARPRACCRGGRRPRRGCPRSRGSGSPPGTRGPTASRTASHHLERQAHPVLEAAAVGVGARVRHGEERRHGVGVGEVQLDAVEAGGARARGPRPRTSRGCARISSEVQVLDGLPVAEEEVAPLARVGQRAVEAGLELRVGQGEDRFRQRAPRATMPSMNARVGLRVAIFRKSMICGTTSESRQPPASPPRSARRPGHVAVVAEAQQRPAGHVADAGRLQHDHARRRPRA